jgi:hypothetical protein
MMFLSEIDAGRRFKIRSFGDTIFLKVLGQFNAVSTEAWTVHNFPESAEVELLPTAVECLYNWLCTQSFTDWHNTGRFNSHLEDNNPKKFDILVDIAVRSKGLIG